MFYNGIARVPLAYLLRQALPLPLLPVITLGAVVLLLRPRPESWEAYVVLGSTILSGAAYFVQGKGYVYHRYSFLVLALLCCCFAAAEALGNLDLRGQMAVATLSLALFGAAPYFSWLTARQRSGPVPGHTWNEVPEAMMRSLQAYRHDDIDGRIQCLDTDAGCYSALFRLDLVQSTGEMGDHLLFWPGNDPAVATLQVRFIAKLQTSPPRLIVLSNKWFAGGQSFELLDSWPPFRTWLEENYAIVEERGFPAGKNEVAPLAFRVYRLKTWQPC